MSMLRLAPLALLAASPAFAQEAPASVTATSPDGSLVLTVATDNDQRPTWSLSRKGQLLFAPSKLGFLLTDGIGLQRGFAIEGIERASADGRWEQPWGERRFVRDHHNELLVRLRQNESWGGHAMNVRFRLFDDGIGFRYELPEQAGLKTAKIADEITEFDLVPKGTAWWIAAGEWNRYEQIYQKTPVDAVATAHTPMTVRLDDGTHLSFHEAALVDYSGMWLKRAEGQKFRATLAPSSKGPRVVRDLPFATPWRTIRIAGSAAGLVESDLELNLNEPNKLGDVSWFKPMKYVGIWWGMIRGDWTWAEGPKHGATTERTKATIDFAAKHGFGGVLVEGWNKGWNGNWFGHGDEFSFTEATPDFDLKAVTDYARAKHVQLIGHHETGGNIKVYEAQLDDAMKLYGRLGVGTVKTGYVADAGGIIAPGDTADSVAMEWHDGQRQVQHHLKVVQTAAKYHVAVDPHEPVKDTGLRRTYPNWVAREGARGMEYNAWGAFANGPDHEPTLVYTRMLSGPMDFTPGVLSLEGANHAPLASTLAKQLGLYLAIYSPIQMAADFPETLEKFPRELDFISKVPADWSESHLIAGEVGDYAIFARKDRNSADWYVGGVNDATARTLTLRFDFLEPGRTYVATIYKDGDGATYLTDARHSIAYDRIKVKKGDSYTLWLAPGGGAAMRLAAGK
ncbi:glycoside hydrolase family 97 protein [Sphingopyxis sp. SCN 67-31]|uniref:glycoside hydrolase family 97 protein n=1 Tax=Sphingopyxis sp. SCN 67-31 TaxID=1660142 RepID=UPI00086BB7E7|nr:glycoside hydrolase family 97 protein [Sphingopyxis sp. SCN 67-31]ODU24639.1 MAG: alpha-glucosidase [Sphingopyxis sp. SCN 67-31]